MTGGRVELGTDHEGRALTFDEATQEFAIGGIATTADRIAAYDRGKQIEWASEELRAWAYECARIAYEHTQQVREAAKPAPAPAQQTVPPAPKPRGTWRMIDGYSPDSIARAAHSLEITAWVLGVTLTVVGALEGAVVGLALVTVFPPAVFLLPAGILLTTLPVAAGLVYGARIARQLALTALQIEVNTRPLG